MRPYDDRRGPITRILRDRADLLLAIAGGGALGSLARWALAEALPHADDEFPLSTFAANVGGSLLLGLLMALVVEVLSHRRYLRPFLGVGFLGGYTTFSTYMLDARSLLAAGRPGTAFLYLAGTLFTGLAAVWLGLALGRGLVAPARSRRSDRRTRR